MVQFADGPEFIPQALHELPKRKLGMHYIPPGQSLRNGYVDSINNHARDEHLNINSFDHIYDTRTIIMGNLDDYNKYHQQSRLCYLTPDEYTQSFTCILN